MFPVIAAVVIPGFELRAALRLRPGLEAAPAALAPLPGTEPLLGSVTAAAEAHGVRPGMRMGEALATCPAARARRAGPGRRSSRRGRGSCAGSRTPASRSSRPRPGTVYFETRGVERLYGGVEPALKRALAAVGAAWDARAGAAERRFAALAAASVARPGQALIVSDDRTRRSSRRCR